MKKQLLAAALAAAMALPASGCSLQQMWDDFLMDYETEHVTDAGHVTVDPEQAAVYVENAAPIFNHMSYTREMFYGKYVMDGVNGTVLEDGAKEAFLNSTSTFPLKGTVTRLSAMPYRIDLGPHCNMTPLNYLSGYEWALLYYYDQNQDPVQVQAAYSVDGNALNFQFIRSFDYDSDNKTLDYQFSGNSIKYYYILNADGLALSNSDGGVQLYPEDLHKETPEVNIYDANPLDGSDLLEGIETINLTSEAQFVNIAGQECPVTGYEFGDDGLLRLKWTQNDVEKSVQVAYLYGDDDGLALMDEEHVYLYNRRSYDLYSKDVNTNLSVSDSERLQNMSDAEIDALRSQVGGLYEDLETAFEIAGVAASVDTESGEVSLDSVVLFDVDDYFISQEGQDMLTNFLIAYTSVIFSEKYDGFVSAVEIQGHTDPTGLLEHNRILSKARADQVMEFCLTEGNGLTPETIAKLRPMLSAVGYASDHPVFGADGVVDNDASRRVSFKFVVSLG